jgi:hypothetical protein
VKKRRQNLREISKRGAQVKREKIIILMIKIINSMWLGWQVKRERDENKNR